MVISTKEQHVLAMIEAGVNFETRTLYITGDVDVAMSRKVIVALEALSREPGEIRIVIDSGGGDEESGYAIHDAICMCENPVIIEGYGAVQSIAAAIFQAGDVRRLAPNASFMIHNGTGPSEEEMKQDAIIDLAEQLKKDNQKYYDILSAATQQPQETIEEWCREEKFFTAEEAVQAGFADEVMTPLKSKMPLKKRRRRKKP
jgi:ATP-dependent protease ClpP protease subunit